MSAKKKKLMIVDGNALIHRAFHALPPTMRTRSGEVVNAVYGFTSILLKALAQLKPDYVAVTFDLPGPTFRDKLYKEYKAQRVKAPDELYEQIPRAKDVVRALNIPIYEKKGFEADDVLATLSTQHEKDKQAETIIVTGDLDTLQLVDNQTKVFTLRKGLADTVTYDAAAVKERYGLTPDQMIDFKALAGDSSDNIPGVKGVGQKTASDLLAEYGTLEKIYQEAKKKEPAIKESVVKKLLAGEPDAKFSKELVTIVTDVPDINLNLADCDLADYDRSQAAELFQELQFQSLMNKLPVSKNHKTPSFDKPATGKKRKISRQCVVLDDPKKLKSFQEKLKKQKHIVFDTETCNLGALKYDVCGISFSWKEGEAFYVVPKSEEMFSALKPALQNNSIKKCGHNIKYDLEALIFHGIKVDGVTDDTMVMSYVLDPGTRAHSLDQVAFAELGYEMQPIEDLIGKGKKQIPFDQVPIKKAAAYSCEDAEVTLRLKDALLKKLDELAAKQNKSKPFREYKQKDDKRWNAKSLYTKIEIPLIAVLAAMENHGILVDKDILTKTGKEVGARIEKIRQDIFKMAGKEFNISSPMQLREILYEKMKLPTEDIKKTKTGFSTAEKELQKLRSKHKIVDKIFKYRELTKLKNTYLDTLPKLVNDKTGRLHTSFNQTVTATGRLSSSDPNLQNIPVRSDEGQEIRRAFVAEKGYKFLSLDYSQIDLRILAHYTEDPALLKTFREGGDIHAAVGSRVFDVPVDKVTANQRRIAKVVNFGIVYGMSAFGLSQTLQIEREEAQQYIDKYFDKHPRVKDYMKEIVEYAKRNNYVETLFGRRRYLPEINSSQYQVRSGAERMAINMPIQGTSSDIVKLAMIAVAESLASYGDDARMLLQVHDELLFEVKEAKLAEVEKQVISEMENCCQLKVPLTVHAKIGNNWSDMEES